MPIHSVSEELNNWYETNCASGRLSWGALSKKTGIAVSNITKIAKGQTAKPKYETARALLYAIRPNEMNEVEDFIASNYGFEENVSFESNADTSRKVLGVDANELLRDFLTFRIFKLSLSGRHHIDCLNYKLGSENVMPRIEVLADYGLVFVDKNGFLCRRSGSQYTRTTDVTAIAAEFKHVVELVANKKVLAKKGNANIDNEVNRLVQWHLSLSKEQMPEFKRDIVEFLDKIGKKYKSNEDSADAVEMFLNLATGRFDFE